MWVTANKDFIYDDKVGQVLLGQIFELGGHRNDQGLIKNRLLAVLDPQPKSAKALEDMPSCGTCGRIFLEEWQRNRCGERHEMTAEDLLYERREKVKKTYEERIIQVGE